MLSFDDYFSDEALIREFCRLRAKLAKKRNDELFLHRISKDSRLSHSEGRAANSWDIFPPRRLWHSYRPQERGLRPSFDLNVQALSRATIELREKTPTACWVQPLERKISAVRDRALARDGFSFGRPRIAAIEKNRKKHEYRPLALFSTEDKIIDSITARYLRHALDVALTPSCLAFRCGKDGKQPPTIHDALETILQMRTAHLDTDIFVAECDIKAFFDCVSHEVAHAALQDLIRDASAVNPKLRIDGRALQIFDAYLNSYCFEQDANGQGLLDLQHRVDKEGRFNWPWVELRVLHGREILPRIGVPQGGALSCLVANAVLHVADKEMARVSCDNSVPLTYLRYCDDMILLSCDRTVCERAYKRYFDILLKLRLPAHPARTVQQYSRSFWEGKSNAPYFWGPRKSSGIPWIQFVGYQIRYDGLVRVRPKSLKKHFQKLTSTADELLATLNPGHRTGDSPPPFAPGLRKSAKQILHRFRQKLISLSVGRIKLGKQVTGPMPMCWTNGFRGLLGKATMLSHLKGLDRHRERQIQRVVRRIRTLHVAPSTNRAAKDVLQYYGSPFSYCAQFRPYTTRDAPTVRSPRALAASSGE
ncbi:MAG TPA: hypothetical protein VN442_26700 [Bryobacteraceae bacterium]|nr:hypothetical protein [Bryobacteraceae bacterium]